jgi:hypothetical protein
MINAYKNIICFFSVVFSKELRFIKVIWFLKMDKKNVQNRKSQKSLEKDPLYTEL